MFLRSAAFLSFALFTAPLLGEDEELVAEGSRIPTSNFFLTRADSLPVESFQDATDPYLEGYIQALVDAHYYEYGVLVAVKDHKVYLANLPKNDLIADSIVHFVYDVPGVVAVEVVDHLPEKEEVARLKYVEHPRVDGIWFPQQTVLFLPLVADPRQPMYSAAYRGGDNIAGSNAVAVALGDEFPFYRWRHVFVWNGDLQIGVDAGIWALFDFVHVPPNNNGDTCQLVNTDYYVGFPLTYAVNRWSFRTRIYHISSHLGDEFIVNNPQYVNLRVNPSFEALDFFASYQINAGIRVYAGGGFIFHSDRSFKLKRLYVEWGSELRLFGKKFRKHRLFGSPFCAIHLENWQQHDWYLGVNVKVGYELTKLQGVGRKMRLYVDYHQGYELDGQFFNQRANFWEGGISWGF